MEFRKSRNPDSQPSNKLSSVAKARERGYRYAKEISEYFDMIIEDLGASTGPGQSMVDVKSMLLEDIHRLVEAEYKIQIYELAIHLMEQCRGMNHEEAIAFVESAILECTLDLTSV